MPQRTADGSLLSDDGRTLFFSIQRFVDELRHPTHCFVCGAPAGSVTFNDEHVLPDWMLQKHNLYDKRINLPNGARYKYGSYVIPCCQPCNTAMGKAYETPISAALSDGFESMHGHLEAQGTRLLYPWMALIFLKVYLKDAQFRLNLNKADEGTTKIADLYAWEELHHVHCVARVFQSGASIDGAAFGSTFIVPLRSVGDRYFDYADSYEGRTIAICSGDVGIVAVLNDAQAVSSALSAQLSTIEGALTPVQFRELFAHAAYVNMHLRARPTHETLLDIDAGTTRIVAQRPASIELEGASHAGFGKLLAYYCRDIVAQLDHERHGKSGSEILELIRQGKCRFLFDDKGEFIRQP